jgi:hypothetical protein
MLIASRPYLLIRTHELSQFQAVRVYSYDKHQFAQPTAFHSELVKSNIKHINAIIKKLHHEAAWEILLAAPQAMPSVQRRR